MRELGLRKRALHREEALRRREALLFKNEGRCQGTDSLPERKNWRLFEWPDTIQTQSSGLGLYFKTLGYFLIVTFLMSLVGIGPLLGNYFADEFTDKYTLIDTGAEPQECDRSYKVCCKLYQSLRLPSLHAVVVEQ